ncbi:MAG: NUDIX domain-containing protein [Frankia sp.]
MDQIRSAGILLYRFAAPGAPLLLIAHMGGPFWSRKDDGAWSIPKGEYEPDETPTAAAIREFTEEIGIVPPVGPFQPLGDIRTSRGKAITIFAVEGTVDLDDMVPGTFTMEWPRGSGREQAFPEVDRAMWATPDEARVKLVPSQAVYVDRLLDLLAG